MRPKIILSIVITVLVTIILMNNTDTVTFWIFGDVQIPKLTILGVLFALGFLVGYLARGKRKRLEQEFTIEKANTTSQQNDPYLNSNNDNYSDEDYIR
jgi:uncharacterized integral membrane protein